MAFAQPINDIPFMTSPRNWRQNDKESSFVKSQAKKMKLVMTSLV